MSEQAIEEKSQDVPQVTEIPQFLIVGRVKAFLHQTQFLDLPGTPREELSPVIVTSEGINAIIEKLNNHITEQLKILKHDMERVSRGPNRGNVKFKKIQEEYVQSSAFPLLKPPSPSTFKEDIKDALT